MKNQYCEKNKNKNKFSIEYRNNCRKNTIIISNDCLSSIEASSNDSNLCWLRLYDSTCLRKSNSVWKNIKECLKTVKHVPILRKWKFPITKILLLNLTSRLDFLAWKRSASSSAMRLYNIASFLFPWRIVNLNSIVSLMEDSK